MKFGIGLRGCLVCFVLGVIGRGAVRGDRRGYVWTYEYMTMPKGQFEIEYYHTMKTKDIQKYDDKNSWEHQVEFEYGLTDHWDVSVYQKAKHTNTSTENKFEYTGSKLRSRYRIGAKGEYPLDTLLYMEYIHPDDKDSSQILEGKLVLAKDIGKFNVAYNQVIKEGISDDGRTEHKYAVGLNYEINPRWKVGIESMGSYTDEKYYLGPTLSWASEKIWAGIGAVGGLNDQSDDLQVRLIVGIPF